MKAATDSHRIFEKTRLMLVTSPEKTKAGALAVPAIQHLTVGDLTDYLAPGDLFVFNSSGTLPSSFQGRVQHSRTPLEVRLASFRGRDASDLSSWMAVTFGSGNWHEPTESRGIAPELRIGDEIEFTNSSITGSIATRSIATESPKLRAKIVTIDPVHPRLIQIKFYSDDLIRALYLHGRPIQYSYLAQDLEVWDQQTLMAGSPLSVEPPSATFPFNWDQLFRLKNRGIEFATLLHAAGLSSTGDAGLDQRLPLNEFYQIPTEVLARVNLARAQGRRVIALGTTVARALESAKASLLHSSSASGYTSLRLGPDHPARVVTTLITGMHAQGTSHAELMKAFCPPILLREAEHEAEERGYRSHEYGDLTLVEGQKLS